MSENQLFLLLKQYITSNTSEEIIAALIRLAEIVEVDLSYFDVDDYEVRNMIFDKVHSVFPNLHKTLVEHLQKEGALPMHQLNFSLF